MSLRGNCHDNAVAESFFQLLKRERIKRKIYTSREDARSDVFDYIEMFYNVKRRHDFNNQLSPVEFEKRYAMSLQGVERVPCDSERAGLLPLACLRYHVATPLQASQPLSVLLTSPSSHRQSTLAC